MESELDSDRIGRIGERQFEVLCERAGLFCNKSVVDVMGWDFIVEFPMAPASQALPLDQGPDKLTELSKNQPSPSRFQAPCVATAQAASA